MTLAVKGVNSKVVDAVADIGPHGPTHDSIANIHMISDALHIAHEILSSPSTKHMSHNKNMPEGTGTLQITSGT